MSNHNHDDHEHEHESVPQFDSEVRTVSEKYTWECVEKTALGLPACTAKSRKATSRHNAYVSSKSHARRNNHKTVLSAVK